MASMKMLMPLWLHIVWTAIIIIFGSIALLILGAWTGFRTKAARAAYDAPEIDPAE